MKLSKKIKGILLKAYFFARKPFIYTVMVLFPASRNVSAQVMKILVVRTDRIGDMVLSIPVIDNLRLKYPDARITLLVRPYLRDIAEMIKSASDILIYDGSPAMMRQIRKKRYDIAIDMLCDHKLESALVTYISGAPVRVGFASGGREILFTHSVRPADPPDKHMVDLCLELLKPLVVPVQVTEPRLELGQPTPAVKKMVAIHPGGYYPSQRWPVELFVELAKRIMDECKEEVVFIGGPDEKVLMDDIISSMGDRRYKLSFSLIKDTILLLEDCKLLICNNSGPLHLAAALGVPTVSTMGPTDPVLWWPRGSNNIVVRKDAKMQLITVDDMYEAVKKTLNSVIARSPAEGGTTKQSFQG